METHKKINPKFFNILYTKGATITVENYEDDFVNGTYKVHTKGNGKLSIKSGQIVFMDPFSFSPESEKPFVQEIPEGDHKCELSYVTLKGESVVASSKVCFGDTSAAYYNMALCKGEKHSDLKDATSIYGAGVDGGVAGFLDADGRTILEEKRNESDKFDKSLIDALNASGDPSKTRVQYANVELDRETGLNLAYTVSGYGDGMYACYFGFSKSDKLVCVVSDFYAIPWNLEDEGVKVTCKS